MNVAASGANRRFEDLFPDARTTATTSWWRRRGRRGALLVSLLAMVVVSVLLVTQAFGSEGTDLRTVVVADRNVDALLTRVGTIEPVSQATVAFPIAGTVASVSVNVGDAVDVGTPLAALDTTSLTDALHQKEAALAQAQLTLSRALAGQAVTPSSGGFGGSATGSSGASTTAVVQSARTPGASSIVLTAATLSTDPALAAAQQAVLSAQQAVDAALASASTALQSALNVCATVTADSKLDAGSKAVPAADAGPHDGISACQSALQDTLDAQSAVADVEHKLSDAEHALDDLLDQRAATPPPTTSQPANTPPSAQPSNGATTPQPSSSTANNNSSGGAARGSAASSGSASGFGSAGGASSAAGGRSSSPTAADLASYQQAVDAASAAVTVADQALAQATIASPIAGTVVGVNLAVGDSVQSASPTANIVVQGAGGFEVSTTVGVDQITHVAVGQRAMVTPDGSHTALDGKVSSIGVTPDPNASNTAYLVVIGLANPNAALHNGATGTVTIVTQSAKSALAVPTSAVTTTGTRHTVEVVNGDAMQPVRVQVGVVGDSWTEIKSGLSRGQRVVLADMSQALPGSATASSNSASANQPVGGTVRRFPGGFTGGGPGR